MSYVSTVLADGAVGFWELGESAFAQAAVDQKGNQNGVYQNTTGLTFGNTGIPGGGGATSVKFIAANSGKMSVADIGSQRVVDTFTLEGWIRLNSAVTGDIISCGNTANGPRLSVASNGFVLGIKTDVGNSVVSASAAVAVDSSFHHVVYTKATTTNKLYVDGVDVTGTVTNQTMATNIGWGIGYDQKDANSFVDGWLAMVAVYPTALSAAILTNHFRQGAALSPVNTVAPVASGSTTVGSVVSTTNGTWTDAGSPTFTYQWQRDVLGNGVYTNILGATASTYTLVVLDDGNDVRCQVTDTDVVGATTANSNSILDTTAPPSSSVVGGALLSLLGVG